MILTNEDKNWLNRNYPLLPVKKNNSQGLIIEGTLHFNAYYDETKNQYIFNPSGIPLDENYYITDLYELIIASPPTKNTIPLVVETKGRIISIAQDRRLKPCDLHVSEHGVCCLCPKLLDKIKYPEEIILRDFMYDLLIPFFYSQSYFEKYDNWHVPPYSHGDLGVLEYYAEVASKEYPNMDAAKMFFNSLKCDTQKLIINSTTISRQWRCLCGKSEKFRKCHPKAMNGLRQLKNDYDQYAQSQQALN